ncbi:MAG TPA: cupredoxin domain-containing protein [Candidatus Binataceae bacterium]|nr:cupredoxin domain-containing protein [Candidatus Binataceae bacterium]
MGRVKYFTRAIGTIAILAAAVPTFAADVHAEDGVRELRFENHRFAPQTLTVPAGQALTVRVVNTDKETIEFESFKLNREKAVSPGETITVHLPALSPGSYDFYDDFHQDVPEGAIVVK